MTKKLTQRLSMSLKLVLAGASLLFGGAAAAQTASIYSFSQSNNAYVPLAGATTISQASPTSGIGTDDDNGYEGYSLPFTFKFAGTDYTSFSVNTNGTFFFGDNAVTGYPYLDIGTNNSNPYALVAGFATDLIGTTVIPVDATSGSNVLTNVNNFSSISVGDEIDDEFSGIFDDGTTITAIDQTAGTITLSEAASDDYSGLTLRVYSGNISYVSSGTAPNRTFTVQWKDYHKYNQQNTGVNFQVILHEGGGIATNQSIDVKYGTVTNNNSSYTVQAGLRSEDITDFNDRTTTTDWTATTAGTTANATLTYSPTVLPPSGLTYTWTPPSACSGAPVAGTAASSLGSVCPDAVFYLTLTGNTMASGLTYQWQSRTSGTSNPFTNIAGATGATLEIDNQTAGTDYRVYVVCTASTLADTSNVVTVSENSTNLCYCTDIGGGGYPAIDSVHILGTTLINNTPDELTNPYLATFPASGNTTADLAQGVSYTMHVTLEGTGNASLWIDYDHSGTFDASEYTQLIASGNDGVVSFSVPGNAVTGLTGLRIRSNYTFYNNGQDDACTYFFGGETEDYLVTIVTGTPCSGTPDAGTISASVTSVCPNIAFNLSATGFSNGTSGLAFQWLSRPAGSTGAYTAISGATNPGQYAVTSQTAATQYALAVVCATTGMVDTSNLITVNENGFNMCYCVTDLGGAGVASIDSVHILTTTLNNNTPGYAPTYYTSYPQSGNTTASLAQGVTYTLHTAFSDAAIASLWIDYDQSGTFDANEFVQITTNGTTADVTFTVPDNAVLGATGLRIRSRSQGNQNGATDACSTFGSGETEDYIVTIIAGTACAGTPTAGTITATATSVCPETAFTLTAAGYSQGTTGLVLQWQSSPAAAGMFTNISGATGPSYTVADQGAATDYRLVISCTASMLGDTSNVVTVGENVVSLCYCTNIGGGGYPAIDSVSIYGTTLANSTPNQLGGPGYITNYPATGSTTATLTQAVQYTVHVTLTGFGNASMWIDYDHSGTFDAGEYVQVIPDGTDGEATFTVPGSALTGITGLRVRSNYDFYNNGADDACTYFFGGETEDYQITIAAGVQCTGTPDAGTVSSSVANACTDVPFTLSATGYTTGVAGLTFQWLSRPAGSTGAYTAISGATNAATYTVPTQSAATQYALAVICTGSGLVDTSNILTVGQNAASQCYCTPVYVDGCSDQDDINDFMVTGVNSTQINDVATGCSNNAYDDRTNESVQFAQGGSYTGNISTEYEFGGEHAIVWIDFDNSGTFDAGEVVATIDDILTTGNTFTLTIPAGAQGGSHRMRVREAYGFGLSAADIDPCISYGYGETHDYTAIIGCTPVAVNLGNDTTICGGGTITLNAGNAGSTFAFSNGATTQTTTVGAGTYSVIVTNANGCMGTDTIVVTAAPAVVVNLGNDTTICSGGTITLNAGNAGSTFAYSNGATTQTTVVSAGTYRVAVTNAAGCIGRDTIVIGNAPPLTVNLGNDTSICSGNTITLNAGNAGSTFAYSNGATTQTTTVGPGAYSVTVTTSAGCTGTDNIVISTAGTPVVNLGPDTTICTNAVLVLNAGGGAGYTYSWTGGASTSQFLTVNSAGTYSVTVTNGSGCSATDAITITTVDPPSNIGITVTGTIPNLGFMPTGTTGASSYAWDFGDGNTSTALSPTHTFSANGTYTVTLFAANSCGFDTTSVQVVITGLRIGNTSLNDAALILYPNPASSFFTLESKNGLKMQSVTVLNGLGAVVAQKDHTNPERETLDISSLAAGIYTVRIQTDKGIVIRRIETVSIR